MATIGCKAVGDKVLIWITGPRGGRQQFRATIIQAGSLIELLDKAIHQAQGTREGCDLFKRPDGRTAPIGDCQGDGHYLCVECIHLDPEVRTIKES